MSKKIINHGNNTRKTTNLLLEVEKSKMKRIHIYGNNISLQLLTKKDLELWLEDPTQLSDILKLSIDSEPLEGHLRNVFKIKIDNMNKDPEYDHWYSYFAIIHKGAIIGAIGSKGKPDQNRSIEVGYGISTKYYNRGFTTEALKFFADHFFKNYGVKTIIAKTERLNIASQKVLRKNGFIKIEDGDLQKWELSYPVFSTSFDSSHSL